jgi:pilus assembly protein Flp/PilA
MMFFTLLLNGAKRLVKNEKGQAMVEYGLIIALVAVLIIGAVLVLTGALDGLFRDIGDALSGEHSIPTE